MILLRPGRKETAGTAAGDVDIFGWSTAATEYGISTSTSVSDYSGDFVDWGKNIGDGSTWRTLSKDEWVYLFETRTNASGLYKYGVTVCGKTNCVIIAPDNWDTSANPLQTSYDATAWATAEAAGLICLPAAGYRNGSRVYDVGDRGYYWSSTALGWDHTIKPSHKRWLYSCGPMGTLLRKSPDYYTEGPCPSIRRAKALLLEPQASKCLL